VNTSKKREEEDKMISATERTRRALGGTMGGIEEYLVFTMETGEDLVMAGYQPWTPA
jgi:hypothetical protein